MTALAARIERLEGEASVPVMVVPAEPRVDATSEELDVLEDSRRAEYDASRLELLQVQESVSELDGDIRRHEESSVANAAAVAAYRKAALAQITSAAMKALSRGVCAEQIDPLSRELNKRWEQLWPRPTGLRLEDDGRLSLEHGGERIAFEHFSGGEKTFSIVMLRMLALQMLSRARFLVLDEPLEHLDARNRRVLARLMCRASESDGPLAQVIVTTYEESLARALGRRGRAGSSAAVVYVRSA
jgi:chromosome segregation ATPase